MVRLYPNIADHPGVGKTDGQVRRRRSLWSNEQIRVDGDFVVAIPARDVLLVTGSRNLAGIAKLRELAAQMVRDSSYHADYARLTPLNGKTM